MNKELLDKYSKISVIIIAIILVISFIGVVYSKILFPYFEQLKQKKIDLEYAKETKKHNEINGFRNNCYAEVNTKFKQRLADNCVHKTGSGFVFDENLCLVNKDVFPILDNYIKSEANKGLINGKEWCSEYFQCSADFLKTNLETKQLELKNCQEKYLDNF